MTPRARLIAGVAAATIALVLGVCAAWPIYETAWLWLVALVALVLGAGIAWARERWRLGLPVTVALTLGAFALSVVPVAVPQAIDSGLLRGLVDGLAAIVLGWKQLLTLTLPVGSYQTVLVPAYLVMLLTALLVVLLAQRAGRWPAFAALPMLTPVAFGTVFGASALSTPLRLGPLTIVAPREIGVWLAAALLAAGWVAWTSGAERRAALRLGRMAGDPHVRRGTLTRAGIGAGAVVVALAAASFCAPLLDAGDRTVPRDRIDPELVVRDQTSPLAEYRIAKRDDTLDALLFTVSSEGALPERLRLAVLDVYDGVDFHVSGDEAGRFTRFPSGNALEAPVRVSVEVLDGYAEIWVPTAALGAPPSFTGPRAAQLADAFYVNRATGTAIAVPGGEDPAQPGLTAGDGYTAEMETAAANDPVVALGSPASAASLIDLEQTPELARWLALQDVGADAAGLTELIDRLRDRGYLSHSMSAGDGELLWLTRLNEEYGTTFESSAGGHSLTRLETLFAQLNAQQVAAGLEAADANLVAAVGDDEQFAAAAALIARALGYESRVVVGVRLAGHDVPGVPACAGTCTGEHLAAWIEVRGDTGEWTPIDATPQVSVAPQRLEQGEQLPEYPTTPEERDASEVDPPIGLGDQGESSNSSADAGEDSWLWPVLRTVGLSLAALLLLLLPFLFLPLAKRLRARRRRRVTQPELRALGAWEELVDRARDAGAQIPAGAGRPEIAATLGTAPAVWAAAQVDRAVFSAHSIDAATADELWRAVDADAAERRAGLTFGGRLRAAYALRSYGIGLKRRRSRVEGDTA